MKPATLFLLTATVLSACTGAPPAADPEPVGQAESDALPAREPDPKAVAAAELAKKIKGGADPAAALQEAGMTTAELDALMYEIAMDPALSEDYASLLGE